MGVDRFVYWRNEHPTFDEIKMTFEDYLGGACVRMHVDGPRITALLSGAPRYPFRRHKGFEKYAEAVEVHVERWIEVFVSKNNIDVITRQTDEFTNVVAQGFAELCRRCWHGKFGDE
jgi:hypothetical protein